VEFGTYTSCHKLTTAVCSQSVYESCFQVNSHKWLYVPSLLQCWILPNVVIYLRSYWQVACDIDCCLLSVWKFYSTVRWLELKPCLCRHGFTGLAVRFACLTQDFLWASSTASLPLEAHRVVTRYNGRKTHWRESVSCATSIQQSSTFAATDVCVEGVGPPRGHHSEGATISSSDNLRLGIGLGSVVWLWQYQELFPATTMKDGFQNGGPFGMVDPNRVEL